MSCSAISGGVFAFHDWQKHSESSERLTNALSGIPEGIRILEPVKASIEDIERVHSPRHVRLLRELSRGRRYIDINTYVTPHSFDVALFAAGSACAAVDRALDGEHCFAMIRPPGHHAESERSMGFCLFNNVAVAAARALKRDDIDRVAIIDWDLHHGNGTQEIFYNNQNVLFCSIHQEGAFPRTGWVDEVGMGSAKGFTLNAPIRAGATIADYSLIFEDVFEPAIAAFKPDIIMISAGQDPLSDDLRGNMNLKPEDFGLLTQIAMKMTDRPLALVLEGGYGPSHGKAIQQIFEALGGKNFQNLRDPARPSTYHLLEILEKVIL
jgi:acetoin utilization deacetylase AcuC-like enzyme